jgi:hypothetical protein
LLFWLAFSWLLIRCIFFICLSCLFFFQVNHLFISPDHFWLFVYLPCSYWLEALHISLFCLLNTLWLSSPTLTYIFNFASKPISEMKILSLKDIF